MSARDGVRWLLVLAALLVLIGLIAYARGEEHHHGDDVGSHGAAASPARF